MPDHLKLVADPSALGVRLFADWYRFGEPRGPVPVVHFIGGAISSAEYQSAAEAEPEAIVAPFRSALPLTSLACVDLVVSFAPPLHPDRAASAATDFADHLWSDLLPRTPNPAPSAVAFVGHAFGAHLATYLALDSAEARALALLGAVRLREATQETTTAHEHPLLTRIFANHDDPAAKGLVADIEHVAPVLDCVPDRRIGRRDFRDYAENGAVRDAFAFVLAMLE
jgi:hypothetical protein